MCLLKDRCNCCKHHVVKFLESLVLPTSWHPPFDTRLLCLPRKVLLYAVKNIVWIMPSDDRTDDEH